MPSQTRRRERYRATVSGNDRDRAIRAQLARLCECGKVACRSEQDARDARRIMLRDHGNATGSPVRFYRCEFGCWHWTRNLRACESIERRKYRAGVIGPGCAAGDHHVCIGHGWDGQASRIAPCTCCAKHTDTAE